MSRITFFEKSIRCAIAIIAFPFSMFQTLLSTYQLNTYKPIGKLIRINDIHIHGNVTGTKNQNTPIVILESGMGGCSLDWSLVQPELSKHTTVLSYDRAGFGWSTKPMDEPTCKNYVANLHLLLKEMNLKPPYILVGHSYGGMIMRFFASEYADEVKGLVLVDSIHENRYLNDYKNEKRIMERKTHLKMFKLGYLLSPIGLPRLLKRHIGVKRLPSNIQKMVTALGRRNNAFKASYLEFLCTIESAKQLKLAAPLRENMPVIVLSAQNQTEDWKEGQSELLNLTKLTKQIWVEQSWHTIQIYQPEAVINAVKSLLKSELVSEGKRDLHYEKNRL